MKGDGLQLHSIDHTDVQLTNKLIFQNPPTSGHLLSPLPPSPGVPHLDQCSPSSRVCRFPLSHTICPPTAAIGGQSPHRAWPLFEQLWRSPPPRPAESDVRVAWRGTASPIRSGRQQGRYWAPGGWAGPLLGGIIAAVFPPRQGLESLGLQLPLALVWNHPPQAWRVMFPSPRLPLCLP